MGTVYEAVDQRLSSVVAIKETLITTDEGRLAFEREASLLANLRHRSLPNVTDHFAEGDGQYLVMQFIPGEDLAQLLVLRQHEFAVADVLHWADEVLNALEYLHSHEPPVLHRDIKPANLKLTREGELFLIDFGLSKGIAGQMETLLTSRSVKGYTPAYSPLEQIHSGGTDSRSDLYSLGATLYHLLTNVAPVDSPTRLNAYDDLQPDPLLPANDVNPRVPATVTQVIAQAMAMNRRNRPANAAEMRRMLREAAPILSEAAVTLRTESDRELRTTEDARGTDALPVTRQTQTSESDAQPPAPTRREPTIREIPSLIERSGRMAAAPPSPTNLAPTPAPSRRKMSTAVLVLLISIGILGVLVVGSVLVLPWLSKRRAVQTQANNSSNDLSEQTSVKPSEVLSKKRFSGDFDVRKALELVYGSYDYQKKYTKWKLTKEDLKSNNGSVTFDAGTVYTGPNLAQSFVQGGVQRFILTTETVPARYDCHACAPLIGAATFSQQGDGWQLDAVTKAISTMGSFGSGPKGKLIKIGADRYGVVFHDGGMNQGISGEAVVIIAEVGESLREILTISEYGGDNSGACGEELAACWKYSSKMDFEPGPNPDYYDIKVTTSGTREDDNGNVRQANALKKYTFVDGKYVPAK